MNKFFANLFGHTHHYRERDIMIDSAIHSLKSLTKYDILTKQQFDIIGDTEPCCIHCGARLTDVNAENRRKTQNTP